MTHILIFNTGSATVKFDLYQYPDESVKIATGIIDHVGSNPHIIFHSDNINIDTKIQTGLTIETATNYAYELITNLFPGTLTSNWLKAVGFRIVHGGNKFFKPTQLTDEVTKTLEEISGLAPLHNAHAITSIKSLRKIIDTPIPFVGVFDTQFHLTIPVYANQYAINHRLNDNGIIKRYGFHGLAHEYMLNKYSEINNMSKENCTIITVQLGSGCSVCAIQNGKSVDTSMGFTPLEGLIMRTRSGDIDPGIIFYLIKHNHVTPSQLENILYTQSGLAGLTETDGNMSDLIDNYDKNMKYKLAVDMFVYKIKKYIGSYLAILDNPEAIIFGGGIGENSAFIRKLILTDLKHLGIKIDNDANNQNHIREKLIVTRDSEIKSYVIPVDESLMIYKYTKDLLS